MIISCFNVFINLLYIRKIGKKLFARSWKVEAVGTEKTHSVLVREDGSEGGGINWSSLEFRGDSKRKKVDIILF